VRLTDRIRYRADPAAVFAMITDRRFQEHKCHSSGATRYQAEVTEDAPGGTRIVTTRQMPTTDLPDFVRSFAGAELTITETSHWGPVEPDGSRTGTVTVEITGVPVRLSGRTRLARDGQTTVQDVDGDLKASVPLLGGKIEKAAEPAIRSAIRLEERVGEEWLTR
jgi:hypothetical protein